jgi:hypothetical protein
LGASFSLVVSKTWTAFLATQTRARLRGEEEFVRLFISLISDYFGSDLDFSGLFSGPGKSLFFSFTRAWARAAKNRANHLNRKAKTRAHDHARPWARA